ncbi:MAG: FG-GAP repeat protein [Pseudomonadota bacterium]
MTRFATHRLSTRLQLGALLLGLGVAASASAQVNGFRGTDYLKASNTDRGDEYGHAVALSGDTMVVGAYLEDSAALGIGGNQLDNNARDAGAVYIYVRDNNRWRLDAYVKASNAEAGDRFGWAVALDGDLMVVGAPEEDSASTGIDGVQSDNTYSNSGAAYVFERIGGRWQQRAYLKASNTDPRDRFGTTVAIYGEMIVVGAPDEDSNATDINGDESNNSFLNSGAAYLFQRNGSRWSQQAYLKPFNTGGGDRFGSVVDIHRDFVVVGAPFESSDAIGVDGDGGNNFALNSGAAYVFRRNESRWSQSVYLKPFNTDPGDLFGTSVAIGELDVVVGAIGEDGSAAGVNGEFDDLRQDAGAAYTFIRDGREWFGVDYLKSSNPDFDDAFGSAVALDRVRIVVSAIGEDSNATGVDGDDSNNGASDSGAAWSFNRVGQRWMLGQYLKASNTDRGDRFGISLAFAGGELLIGASGEESSSNRINGDQTDNAAPSAGAAYRYEDPAAFPVAINPGMNDAWFNPVTPGQGLFINAFPDNGTMFVAWFTYDINLPDEALEANLGWPGHRWLTAQGPYSNDTAELEVFLTSGGLFDQVEPAPEVDGPIGTMRLLWLNCDEAFLLYELTQPVVSGVIPLRRPVEESAALCEALADAEE